MATAATVAATVGAAVIGAASQRNASRRAASSQSRAQDLALRATELAEQRARAAAIPLFGSAQQNALAGFQGALDIFGQTVPAQSQVFQAGNVGAQQALLAGLPQFQNAILGGNVDLSQLQAQTLDLPDFSNLNLQLPDFTSIQQSLNPPQNLNAGFAGVPRFTGAPRFTGIVSPGASELRASGALGGFGSTPAVPENPQATLIPV